MPAMTNPDDFYQQLINQRAYKGTNGLLYCSICDDPLMLMRFEKPYWHCVTCGEER